MAIAEEIQDLNKRISGLEKKQEEVKRTLAVEEHKLSESIETEMERLKGIIEEAEKQYEKFQELR